MGQLFQEEDDTREFECEALLESNALLQYEDLLSKYGEWTSFKREIGIASLLSPGKKICLEIEAISIIVPLGCEEKTISIQSSALKIKKMSFILKDGKIDKLSLTCRTIATPMGKIVKNLIDASIPIEIKPHIIDNKVVYFYVETDGTAA
jgi:hypothetical protein